MTREEMDAAIQKYLDDGGEIITLREATAKDQAKAHRRVYHQDKAMSGSERSKDALAQADAKEKTMIFSRTERWKA